MRPPARGSYAATLMSAISVAARMRCQIRAICYAYALIARLAPRSAALTEEVARLTKHSCALRGVIQARVAGAIRGAFMLI